MHVGFRLTDKKHGKITPRSGVDIGQLIQLKGTLNNSIVHSGNLIKSDMGQHLQFL